MLKSLVRKILSELLEEKQKVAVFCIRDKELYPEDLKQAKEGDAGTDLKCSVSITINPQQTILVSTGVKLFTGNSSVVGLLFPRSSFSKLGLSVPNSVGVIDSGYQGEFMLPVRNTSYSEKVTLSRGERICQVLYTPVLKPVFYEVVSFPESARGSSGFGSSGKY